MIKIESKKIKDMTFLFNLWSKVLVLYDKSSQSVVTID